MKQPLDTHIHSPQSPVRFNTHVRSLEKLRGVGGGGGGGVVFNIRGRGVGGAYGGIRLVSRHHVSALKSTVWGREFRNF